MLSLYPRKPKFITNETLSTMYFGSSYQLRKSRCRRSESSHTCFLLAVFSQRFFILFAFVELSASRFQVFSHISSHPPETSLWEVPMVHTKQCHSHKGFPCLRASAPPALSPTNQHHALVRWGKAKLFLGNTLSALETTAGCSQCILTLQ